MDANKLCAANELDSNWSDNQAMVANEETPAPSSQQQKQELKLLCDNKLYTLVPQGDYPDIVGNELEDCTFLIEATPKHPDLQITKVESYNVAIEEDTNVNENNEHEMTTEHVNEIMAEHVNEHVNEQLYIEPPENMQLVQPAYTIVYTICKSIYDVNNQIISNEIAHTEAYPADDLPINVPDAQQILNEYVENHHANAYNHDVNAYIHDVNDNPIAAKRIRLNSAP